VIGMIFSRLIRGSGAGGDGIDVLDVISVVTEAFILIMDGGDVINVGGRGRNCGLAGSLTTGGFLTSEDLSAVGDKLKIDLLFTDGVPDRSDGIRAVLLVGLLVRCIVTGLVRALVLAILGNRKVGPPDVFCTAGNPTKLVEFLTKDGRVELLSCGLAGSDGSERCSLVVLLIPLSIYLLIGRHVLGSDLSQC
jgi:hypothetical protein